jgi:hypothetical protein
MMRMSCALLLTWVKPVVPVSDWEVTLPLSLGTDPMSTSHNDFMTLRFAVVGSEPDHRPAFRPSNHQVTLQSFFSRLDLPS